MALAWQLRIARWWFGLVLITASGLSARDDPSSGAPAAPPPPTADKPAEPQLPDPTRPIVLPPSGFEVELLDGTLLRGELNIDAVEVVTKYGPLKIPLSELESISPGLQTRMAEQQRLSALLDQLGADAYADRQQAQAELTARGPQVAELVRAAASSTSAKRSARAKAILDSFAKLEAMWGATSVTPLAEQDEVTTREFTANGRVQLPSLAISGLYGTVQVELQHVLHVRRASQPQPSEFYASAKVTAEHNAAGKPLDSKIRVRRCDTVSIRASGSIKRDSSGYAFTPVGSSNYGYFNEAQRIMMGALLVQVGASGEPKLAGVKHSFVAEADGPLHFSLALSQQFTRYNLEGAYDVEVRVASLR